MDTGRRGRTDNSTSSLSRGAPPLATLCYQSRAKTRPSPDDLAQLVQEAQERNRRSGVTGMLVHEGDRFFQWLEGPETALDGLWSSIKRDERHDDIELLGEGVTPTRLFSEWDLKFLHRPAGEQPTLDSPAAPAGVETDVGATSGAWRLAELALAGDGAGLDASVRDQRAAGDDARAICRTLLEPAAHLLGDWWCEERCSSFEVTIALSKLQNLARSLEAGEVGSRRVAISGHHVLISPSPRETHMLGATLLGGFFRQAGWSVQAEFPKTDAELVGLVKTQWFDAIALTLSDVFTRGDRLAALVKTITDVRAASRNPTMAVIVGGRAFRNEPSRPADRVGADVHYTSAGDAVGDLDYWLFTHRFTQDLSPGLDEAGLAKLRPIDLVSLITPALSRRADKLAKPSDRSDPAPGQD
jgi:methanogenic corrinoid protein MtbC1